MPYLRGSLLPLLLLVCCDVGLALPGDPALRAVGKLLGRQATSSGSETAAPSSSLLVTPTLATSTSTPTLETTMFSTSSSSAAVSSPSSFTSMEATSALASTSAVAPSPETSSGASTAGGPSTLLVSVSSSSALTSTASSSASVVTTSTSESISPSLASPTTGFGTTSGTATYTPFAVAPSSGTSLSSETSLESVETAVVSAFTSGTSIGNITVRTTLTVPAGTNAPTIVPFLSLVTSGASTMTVTAGSVTLNALFSGTSTASQEKPSASIPAGVPVSNATVPATSTNVTYSAGNWVQNTPDNSGVGSSAGEGGATPLAPNLNNQNVPTNLQCPSTVTPQQTRSSNDLGATVSYSFVGTAVFAQVVPRNNSGVYTAWVDDLEPQTYDGYQMFAAQQQVLPGSSPSCQVGFSATGLANRTHVMHIKIVAPATAAQNEGGGTGLTLAGFTTTTVGTASQGGTSSGTLLRPSIPLLSGLAFLLVLLL